jgi:hypothetical protein
MSWLVVIGYIVNYMYYYLAVDFEYFNLPHAPQIFFEYYRLNNISTDILNYDNGTYN